VRRFVVAHYSLSAKELDVFGHGRRELHTDEISEFLNFFLPSCPPAYGGLSLLSSPVAASLRLNPVPSRCISQTAFDAWMAGKPAFPVPINSVALFPSH
jgi:hypothetical protein